MHEHTRALIAHLQAQHAKLRAALEAIPSQLRRQRPGPERWSAAEIVEHLAIVEDRFLKMLKGAPASGSGPAESPVILLDLDGITDRSVRVKAQETAHPSGTIDDQEAWQRLDALRSELERELIDRDAVDLSAVTRDHARFGTLNLYQWIFFAGAHEARHALQMEEAASELVSKAR